MLYPHSEIKKKTRYQELYNVRTSALSDSSVGMKQINVPFKDEAIEAEVASVKQGPRQFIIWQCIVVECSTIAICVDAMRWGNASTCACARSMGLGHYYPCQTIWCRRVIWMRRTLAQLRARPKEHH